jgi:hypothetical protein
MAAPSTCHGDVIGLLAAAVILSTTALAQPNDNSRGPGERPISGNGRCSLHSDNNSIQHWMIDMLEGAAFDNKPIDRLKAEHLIDEAEALVASIR